MRTALLLIVHHTRLNTSWLLSSAKLKRNITNLKHQNRLLRVVKIIECIVQSLLRLTEDNMDDFFRIVFYTILSFHHTWSRGK